MSKELRRAEWHGGGRPVPVWVHTLMGPEGLALVEFVNGGKVTWVCPDELQFTFPPPVTSPASSVKSVDRIASSLETLQKDLASTTGILRDNLLDSRDARLSISEDAVGIRAFRTPDALEEFKKSVK